MLSKNEKITAVVIVVLIVAGLIYYKKSKTVEGYWDTGAPRSLKVMTEAVSPNGEVFSLPFQAGGQQAVEQANMPFISTANFQSLLAPRFNSGGYGPYITYNLTDYKNQGVPCNPLGYSKMAVTENFKNINCGQCGGQCGASLCSKSGMDLSSMPSVGINKVGAEMSYDTAMADQQMSLPEGTDTLPVGTMDDPSGAVDGGQYVIMDRYMFANKRSRLQGQGDLIRGDLAIVPDTKGWFQVSVNPVVDLNQGALNAMAGFNNSQGQELAALINKASGRSINTIGGMDLTSQLTNMGQDLSVSVFP